MLPTRYLTWVAFGAAAVAAFEADRLRIDLEARRGAAIALLPVAGALVVAALFVSWRLAPLHAAAGGLASQRHALILSLAALGGVAAAAIAAAVNRTAARRLPLLLAAVAAVELGIQGSRLHRFGRPADLFPETPLTRFLRSRPGPFRAGGGGAVLFPNSNVFAGVEDIRTHDPVERRDYVDFLDRAGGYPPADYFKRIADWNAPALDLLNLRYLAGEPGEAPPGPKWRLAYSGTDGVVFENSLALPRVFGADRIPPSSRGAADGFVISSYRERTNEISFRSSAPARTAAVVGVVQDGGWAATDEAGRPLPVSRAENLLIRLELPSGNHGIRLRYRPPGFLTGCIVSAVSAVCVAAAALMERRRRRRRDSSESRSG
ncbi:MAG: YfhO family protein [Acidobacteria bacterium]|nr:YfhO family protein [Acidobacteriota bacterium]